MFELEVEEQIKQLYLEEKWSIAQVSSYLGFNRKRVSNYLREAGLLRERGTSAELKNRIYDLYCQGYLKSEIADTMEVDRKTITNILYREFGVEKKARRCLYDHLDVQIGQGYQAGKSTVELSEEFGVSCSAITQALSRQDIPLRTLSEAARNKGIDFYYFDQLTPMKSRQLGAIWGIGYFKWERETPYLILRGDTSRLPVLEFVTQGWMEVGAVSLKKHVRSNSIALKFSATPLLTRFEALGFGEVPSDWSEVEEDAFWSGFLFAKVRIQTNGIYLSLKDHSPEFIQGLQDYLTKRLSGAFAWSKVRNGYMIRQRQAITALLVAYPELQDYIQLYQNQKMPLVWASNLEMIS